MKYVIVVAAILLVMALCFAAGAITHSEVNINLEKHEKRLKAFKEVCHSMNSTVNTFDSHGVLCDNGISYNNFEAQMIKKSLDQ